MHLLQTRNIISCPSFAALREKLFASAARLLENKWHCAFRDNKKVDWFLNGISHADFETNVRFFQYFSIVYFLVQPFLLTSISLCMFCTILTCEGRFSFNMHCKQHNLSR